MRDEGQQRNAVMKRISSPFTVVSKWVFPALWYGILVFFIVASLMDGSARSDPFLLIGPVFMGIISFFFMRRFAWDLADTVDDGGTHLVVRRHGVEERVPFENIMNVSYSAIANPRWITLRLVKPGVLGANISFSPKSKSSLNPFARNDVAESLIERAYRARTRSA